MARQSRSQEFQRPSESCNLHRISVVLVLLLVGCSIEPDKAKGDYWNSGDKYYQAAMCEPALFLAVRTEASRVKCFQNWRSNEGGDERVSRAMMLRDTWRWPITRC
jgi:hypothetical protein